MVTCFCNSVHFKPKENQAQDFHQFGLHSTSLLFTLILGCASFSQQHNFHAEEGTRGVWVSCPLSCLALTADSVPSCHFFWRQQVGRGGSLTSQIWNAKDLVETQTIGLCSVLLLQAPNSGEYWLIRGQNKQEVTACGVTGLWTTVTAEFTDNSSETVS